MDMSLVVRPSRSRNSPEPNGANPTFATLRRVSAKLPPEVRTTAVRVDPAARPGLSAGSVLPVLTLADLTDLRQLLSRGDTG